MHLAEYLAKRSASHRSHGRGKCLRCLRPPLACYCAGIRPFTPGIRFLILTHIREAQKRIATGRMATLAVQGARQVVGEDFSADSEVNALLSDPALYPVVLYPGADALNLSQVPPSARAFPRIPLVIVIDGTWSTAPKMLIKSHNLRGLPRISYDALEPSRFLVRRQPEAYCHSTIEAIHHVIDLLGPSYGFHGREHDHMLRVFDSMVRQQQRSQQARNAVAL